MNNILIIILIIVNIFLLFAILRIHKQLKWIKKTYDRNFKLAHGILNTINKKTKADEKLILQKNGAMRFWSPDEYQETVERIEDVKEILEKSIEKDKK